MGGAESTPEIALPFIEFCEPYQSYIRCFTKIGSFCEYALKEECVHKELDDHGKPCYIQHDGAGSFKVVDYPTKLNCFDKFNPELAALYNAQVKQWRDEDSGLLEVCYKLMREDVKVEDLNPDCERKYLQIKDNCLRCDGEDDCVGAWHYVKTHYTDIYNEMVKQEITSCDYFKERSNPGKNNCFPTDTIYEECEDEKPCEEDSKGNCTCPNETVVISKCAPTFHTNDAIKSLCNIGDFELEDCGNFLHIVASDCKSQTDKSVLISQIEFSKDPWNYPQYSEIAKHLFTKVDKVVPNDVGVTCGYLLQHAGEGEHDDSFDKMNLALQKIKIL